MRISDWSSDVCSSDLHDVPPTWSSWAASPRRCSDRDPARPRDSWPQNTRIQQERLQPRALQRLANSQPNPETGKTIAQKETPQPRLRGFGVTTLAMTYSRMLGAHYHRLVRVSLPSSGWARVVPRRHSPQGMGGGRGNRG